MPPILEPLILIALAWIFAVIYFGLRDFKRQPPTERDWVVIDRVISWDTDMWNFPELTEHFVVESRGERRTVSFCKSRRFTPRIGTVLHESDWKA